MKAYNYCSKCGLALSPNGLNIPTCTSCNISYYKNSKPTAGVLPVKDGKVLLARRGEEPHKGEIDIIGGFLEDGEHPLDGARREALEESNLIIEPTELLDIVMDEYSIGNHKTLNIYYVGEIKSGEMKASDDVVSLEWINISDLPENEGFASVIHAFAKLKQWYKVKTSTLQPQ